MPAMPLALPRSPAVLGPLAACAGVACFSVNDMAFKLLSGDYALHQLVLIRSLVAMAVLLAVLVPRHGGLAALRTRRPGLHLLRGCCVVLDNMAFFLALATLPLAEGVAIFFVAPLLIAVASVVFLGEHVGPRRWTAIAIGLVGVLVVLRPGSELFQPAALLPVAAACGYAALHMLTRVVGRTDGAVTMAVYIQLCFILVSGGIGLALGHGRFAGTGDPSLDFLLRAWTMPGAGDWAILLVIGVTAAFGGFFISHAYRIAPAAAVAPFEYVAIPMSVAWGIAVFGEFPDTVALLGIALIAGSGLFMVWRESRVRADGPARPRYRR